MIKVKMQTMKTIIKKAYLILFVLTLGSCSSSDSDSGGETVDNSPPTQPTSLASSNVTLTSLDLSWSPSTDNIGVLGYSVYKNNSALNFTQSTSTTISGLTQNTTYTFKVKAKDAANNESDFSNTISVTTLQDDSTLQIESGDIETYIGNVINSVPGSSGNNYNAPLTSQLNTWDAIVTSIIQDNINDAVMSAGEVGYQITEFTDTTLSPNQIFYILEKKSSSSNYWGTYVFSKTPVKDNLVLMAPHIKNDTNTGKQALYCFKNNVARVLMINGTHRCNNSETSSCSGTTSTCGSNDPYRISDLAHTVTSAYQKTTENLLSSVSNSVFVQLHGFGQDAGDPYVILSNGTTQTPSTDYATLLKNALLVEDNTLTFKIAHIDRDWTRLRGFNNTQGRLINNSTNACSSSATTTTGRFIHVEQERTKLRESESGWIKMSNALNSVF